MDISADGGSYGVDFQKQSGPRHIVNIKGPFFQRGSADPGSDQQKEQQTQSSFPNISLSTSFIPEIIIFLFVIKK